MEPFIQQGLEGDMCDPGLLKAIHVGINERNLDKGGLTYDMLHSTAGLLGE